MNDEQKQAFENFLSEWIKPFEEEVRKTFLPVPEGSWDNLTINHGKILRLRDDHRDEAFVEFQKLLNNGEWIKWN